MKPSQLTEDAELVALTARDPDRVQRVAAFIRETWPGAGNSVNLPEELAAAIALYGEGAVAAALQMPVADVAAIARGEGSVLTMQIGRLRLPAMQAALDAQGQEGVR